MTKIKLLTIIDPVNQLHLGDYIGSMSHLVRLQNNSDYQCFFCIDDLEALKLCYSNKTVPDKLIFNTVAAYIASGVNIKKNPIFCQSMIPAYNRLACTLIAIGSAKQNINMLLSHIMLNSPDVIAIKKKQQYDFELVKKLALTLNGHYKQDFIKIPKVIIIDNSTNIMSLRDGNRLMSQHDTSSYSRIDLNDDEQLMAKKIIKAKTDSIDDLYTDIGNRPQLNNLFNIYSCLSGKSKKHVVAKFANAGFAKLKSDLANLITNKLGPVSNKYNHLIQDNDFLEQVLNDSANTTNIIADDNFNTIKRIMGLI